MSLLVSSWSCFSRWISFLFSSLIFYCSIFNLEMASTISWHISASPYPSLPFCNLISWSFLDLRDSTSLWRSETCFLSLWISVSLLVSELPEESRPNGFLSSDFSLLSMWASKLSNSNVVLPVPAPSKSYSSSPMSMWIYSELDCLDDFC